MGSCSHKSSRLFKRVFLKIATEHLIDQVSKAKFTELAKELDQSNFSNFKSLFTAIEQIIRPDV